MRWGSADMPPGLPRCAGGFLTWAAKPRVRESPDPAIPLLWKNPASLNVALACYSQYFCPHYFHPYYGVS
jgi:hypothetical protein